MRLTWWSNWCTRAGTKVGLERLASYTIEHTTNAAQTRHSACARRLESPRRHDTCMHTSMTTLRFTASTRSLHTLDTTRHRRRFHCCIHFSIAFVHTDDNIGNWTGVGSRLCWLDIIASNSGNGAPACILIASD